MIGRIGRYGIHIRLVYRKRILIPRLFFQRRKRAKSQNLKGPKRNLDRGFLNVLGMWENSEQRQRIRGAYYHLNIFFNNEDCTSGDLASLSTSCALSFFEGEEGESSS